MTIQSVERSVSIEQELKAYKNFVDNLKYGFTYIDKETNLEISKTRNKNDSEVKVSNRLYQDIVYDINPSQDIDIEILESFLQPIVDLIPHHVTFTDENGVITLANKQMSFDYSIPQDEIIGMHISELLGIPDDQIVILETIRTKKPIKNREILDKNYGVISTSIISDQHGTLKRVISSFQFLNAIREAEKRGLAGKIATGIAHEIRNPLTIVSGFLQVMEKSVTGEYSNIIRDVLIPELNRTNDIISNFLSVSKETPKQEYEVSPNDYMAINLGNLFQSEVILNGIDLVMDLDKKLKEKMIKINKDEITQVFLNLMKNSIEAKSENLKITMKTEDIGDKVRITFSDNGCGISPAQMIRIFDPFFTTKGEGTGLGLSVSKKIIESHGGEMFVESDLNGTIFEIELPLIKN